MVSHYFWITNVCSKTSTLGWIEVEEWNMQNRERHLLFSITTRSVGLCCGVVSGTQAVMTVTLINYITSTCFFQTKCADKDDISAHEDRIWSFFVSSQWKIQLWSYRQQLCSKTCAHQVSALQGGFLADCVGLCVYLKGRLIVFRNVNSLVHRDK